MEGRRGSRRVLWVTEEPPDRGYGGGSIRQAYLLESLAQAFRTDLLTIGSVADEGVRAAAANIIELPRREVLMPENPVARGALQLAIAFGSPYPLFAYSTSATAWSAWSTRRSLR